MTAPATDPPPTTAPVEAVVAEAYAAALAAEFDAYATADETNQQLNALHVDPVLKELRDRMFGMKLLGQVSSRPDPSAELTEVLEVTVNGDRANLLECTIDDSVVSEPATGRIINDTVVSILRRAVMVQDAGTWKLTERTVVEERVGGQGCAEQPGS